MHHQAKHHDHGHGGQTGHVSSLTTLFSVFAALIVLTIVTVGATKFDLGEWNLILAIIVATIKAGLVAMFFMHLAYDSGFNRIFFFGSFLFVALFLFFTLLDTGEYQGQVDWSERVLPASAPK